MSFRTGLIAVLICAQSHVHGVVRMTSTTVDGPVHFNVKLTHMKPGKHGFHVHKFGDLRDGCETLGTHYNPRHKQHGDLNEIESHLGDLGNIHVNAKGKAQASFVARFLTLPQLLGRSILVHANRDDLGRGQHYDSKTTGHSGHRVLCGIVGYAFSERI